MSTPGNTDQEARIDRWLWASRIFKSRSRATEACRSGRVRINGRVAKASSPVHPEAVIEVRMPPISRTYRVIAPAVKRVSARLAGELREEITPTAELDKLARFQNDPVGFLMGHRERGSGRPTKKERRETERLRRKTP